MMTTTGTINELGGYLCRTDIPYIHVVLLRPFVCVNPDIDFTVNQFRNRIKGVVNFQTSALVSAQNHDLNRGMRGEFLQRIVAALVHRFQSHHFLILWSRKRQSIEYAFALRNSLR